MMRSALALVAFLLLLPSLAEAQFAEAAKRAYEALFTHTVRLSIEPIAPTAGVTAGVGLRPKDWHTEALIKSLSARASASTHGYWALDGSFAWQSLNDWRIETYTRLRSANRLNHFGLGNDSSLSDRSDFAFLDRRLGFYGYRRPAGWLAVGGRLEALWPRARPGRSPTLPSVDRTFPAGDLPGFGQNTNFIYVGAFANLSYPYVRSERPLRGGDYAITYGEYLDLSGTEHTFGRLDVEGQERFPIVGNDRLLTIHAWLSASHANGNNTEPFYLMDTLGGADNLRGFKDALIGADETTATLRSFESFRFRDRAIALLQIDFRQRLWSQVFLTAFADAGVVAPTLADLGQHRLHRGVGIGVGVFRANALAIRAELSLWGGENHTHYLTPGRALSF